MVAGLTGAVSTVRPTRKAKRGSVEVRWTDESHSGYYHVIFLHHAKPICTCLSRKIPVRRLHDSRSSS